MLPPPSAAACAESLRGRERKSSRLSLEWVYDSYVKASEVSFVPRRHFEAMNPGGGRNHCILTQGIGLARHHAGPFPEAYRIHRYEGVCGFHKSQPGLDLARHGGVLPTGQFHTGL